MGQCETFVKYREWRIVQANRQNKEMRRILMGGGGGICITIWTCLQGVTRNVPTNRRKGLIQRSLRYPAVFVRFAASRRVQKIFGIGGDSFPNARSPNRHMLGGRAHLPEYEAICSKMIKFEFLLLLYHILQVTHCLTFGEEGTVGFFEKPTEEGEVVI